jgi:carboxymethylenebutenolidase
MHREDVALGHLVHPAQGGPHPGVVMIHDVWGLSDHTRDLAGRLAGEGFAVLALDLYRREAEVKIENPGEWMRGLSDPQVLEDVQAGVDFLTSSGAVQGRKIGVTGFCMGGMYALLAACSCSGLSGSVAYYGLLSHRHGILHDPQGLDPARKPREPLDVVADLRCPLLAFFGDRDEFVPRSDIEQLRARLAASAQPAEVVVYEGVGHAFMNDTRPDAFAPEIAARAWARMLDCFRARLS